MNDPLLSLQAHLEGRYLLIGEVARGGMAAVYRATDLEKGTEVAVKVLRPEIARAIGPARFLREIRILRLLRHPNIVPLIESRDAGGILYFITPYIAGASLQRRLENDGPLPYSEVARIARDIAAALDHAHAREVVHRDMKPGNVLMDGERALVCDFGIARVVELASGERFGSSSGFAIGTPAYMSPEQATGGQIDGRTDVYGLGCVLYEMLTGEPPFTGATAQAVLARSLSGDLHPVRTVRPEITREAEAAIRSALASDPDRRPGTAGELVRRFAGPS